MLFLGIGSTTDKAPYKSGAQAIALWQKGQI